MKKLMLVVTTALLISSSLFAQNFNASIKLPDGSSTVRINVGDNNNRDVMGRMIMLERAVRDLQNRVYQLEDSAPSRVNWMCKVTAFSKTFFGEGDSLNQAERRTVEKCQREYDGMFCKNPSCSRN